MKAARAERWYRRAVRWPLAVAAVAAVQAGLARSPGLARADEPVTLVVSGSAAPGFVSKAKEGERPRDLPDAAALLEGLPGLRVRRLAGDGTFATLSIRGAASNQVGVMLAGVPLTGAADPSLDWATLPLWPGATARVYRTFAPASMGGGYLGGIVELAPIEAGSPERAKTEVYDALSSFGAYRVRLADTRQVGVFRLATGVSYSRQDGDFVFFDPVLGADVTRKNARSAQAAALVHARGELDRWTLLATALASLRQDGVAGRFEVPLRGAGLDRDRVLAALEARRTDDAGRFLARVWARRDGRRFESTMLEGGLLPGVARTQVLGVGGSVARSARLGALTLDGRLEPMLEASGGKSIGGLDDPKHTRTALGLIFDATLRASDTWSWVLAARADARTDAGTGANAQSRREVLPVAHAGFEWRAAPRADGGGLSMAGHLGTLARPPSFLELLGDGGVYRAAPGLASERAYAADLGLRLRGGERLKWELELVGFAWEVRDLIVIRPVGLATFRAENIGAARILGGEVSGAAVHGPLRAVVSYTHLSTEDRTESAPSRGAPLPGRPAHDVTVDLSARLGPATLRYGFDLVSATTLDRAGLNRLPTRAFHGAGVRVDVGAASVVFEVANLFDQRTVNVPYESSGPARPYPISDFQGYPLPGRRFTLAVRGSL